jgi:hypothetical protein
MCLAAAVSGALGLTDEEIFRELRFNLTDSGARTVGLGGAFVAVADDSAAVTTNPAGLFALTGPSAIVEYRSRSDDVRYVASESGSLEVDTATGDRQLPFFGVTSVSNPDTVNDVSLLGIAWPLKAFGGRVVLTGSRHLVLSEEQSLTSGLRSTGARFAFEAFPNTVNDGVVEAYSVETLVSGASSAEIVYWSAGASVEVHEDFSLGYTVTYATLDLEADTTTRVIDPLELFLDPGHPRLPAQPTADVLRTRIDDTDSGFAYSIGIHWHPDTVFAGGASPWTMGAVFRKGASFDVSEASLLNEVPDQAFANKIVVPDRYTVGLGYRLRDRWLFVADVERIEYSDMLEGFRTGVNYLTSGRVADGAFGTNPDASIRFDADDGTLPRAGVEYAFVPSDRRDWRVALRAGYFRTPDGRIRMVEFNSDDPDVNAVYLEAFGDGDDENHATLGAGLTWGRSAFDVAADISDEGTEIVGSYIFSWSGGTGPPTGP